MADSTAIAARPDLTTSPTGDTSGKHEAGGESKGIDASGQVTQDTNGGATGEALDEDGKDLHCCFTL